MRFVCLFVFMAWICSLYRILDVSPLCSTFLNGYSFTWYTPLTLYMSFIYSFGFEWVSIVLVVLKAIPIALFLNRFVIVLISGP
jgi:hypothetical protein